MSTTFLRNHYNIFFREQELDECNLFCKNDSFGYFRVSCLLWEDSVSFVLLNRNLKIHRIHYLHQNCQSRALMRVSWQRTRNFLVHFSSFLTMTRVLGKTLDVSALFWNHQKMLSLYLDDPDGQSKCLNLRLLWCLWYRILDVIRCFSLLKFFY